MDKQMDYPNIYSCRLFSLGAEKLSNQKSDLSFFGQRKSKYRPRHFETNKTSKMYVPTYLLSEINLKQKHILWFDVSRFVPLSPYMTL